MSSVQNGVGFVIVNQAQFLGKLNALGLVASRRVLTAAAMEGMEVIKDEWVRSVPVEDGHYRKAVKLAPNVGGLRDALGGVNAAVASVYVGKVGGVPDDEQPDRYAGVLEFGGKLGYKQHGSVIPAQHIVRGTLDRKADEAVEKVEHRLYAALAAIW